MVDTTILGGVRELKSASSPLSDFGDNDNQDLDGLLLSIKMCADLKEKILEYDQRKAPDFV
jgi:hypothetical protein